MTNHFKPTAGLLALLKAGWQFRNEVEDIEFEIYVNLERKITVSRLDLCTNKVEYSHYPLTAAGLQQAAERVNLQTENEQ